MKHGTKTVRKDDDPKVKLASILARTKSIGECLVYTGGINSHGYPVIVFRRKPTKGSRLVYTLVHGKIPTGKMICHTCDNRACLNPMHLYAGSAKDNMRDCMERGRHGTASVTHCKNGHEYTKENTCRDRNGRRFCRTCRNVKQAQYYKTWKRKKNAKAANSN